MKSIIKSNIFGLGTLLGLSFVLICITNHYILTINFYNNNGDPLSGIPEQEGAVFESLQKWIYLSTAGYLLFKLSLISLILYTALYLADHPVSYSKIFNVVILSEYIFFVPAIIKIFWFHFEYPNGTLLAWQRLSVFSALSLFDSVSPDWYYPLQTLNLFEIGYWFLLTYGISRVTRLNFDQSLRVVVFSYLPALFIWAATVAFCTLMIIPNKG
jgi:hypothetical protein